ncbi:MAG: YqgE/AlgH family protein [Deltaproteobacteria bacterium]|nr:YqgE/AlgH family protein [Deltaproteobacteria bacterium]
MNGKEIAPGLLLAMPQLGDPNFFRAVVLMVEHGDSGSFGLIVNRQTEVSVGTVLEALGIPWNGDADALIWEGGPVMPQSGWVLHQPTDGIDPTDSVAIGEGIVLSTSTEQLHGLAARPPSALRFVMGYSGWGAGQLEGELSEGVWLTADATRELIFDTAPDRMWEAAIRSLGIDPATLVPGTGIH